MCDHLLPVKSPSGAISLRPCGHCVSCLKKYQQQVTDRLSIECEAWKRCKNGSLPIVFFTLDYRPEAINKLLHFYDEQGLLQSYRYRGVVSPALAERFNIISYNQTIKVPEKERLAYQRAVEDTFHSFQPFTDFRRETIEKDFVPSVYPQKCISSEVTPLASAKTIDGHTILQVHGSKICSPVLSVNTCNKQDIQQWLKRCRRRFEYHVIKERCKQLEYNGIFRRYSPRMSSATWTNHLNKEMPLPFSALTPTFKYYITSEYGPATFRPHVHGVLFGVTEVEFRKYFAPDWRKHFGRCVFETFNPLKGGMLYLGKYCAKGFFEHPLCRKNEIWSDSNGYIHQVFNKDYYYNKKHFGINAPLVDKTFHLSSKGLGIRYAFKDNIQSYWGVKLLADTSSRTPNYVVTDREVSFISSMDFNRLNQSFGSKYQRIVYENPESPLKYNFINYPYEVQKFIKSGKARKLVAFSTFNPQQLPDDSLCLSQAKKCFSRSYACFNKLENSLSQKVFECPLHRYYSRWLVSLSLQFARAFAVCRQSDADYNRRKSLLGPHSAGEARFNRVAALDYNKTFSRFNTDKKQLLSLCRDYQNTKNEIVYETQTS